MTHRRRLVRFGMKNALCQPLQVPCVFSGKMRLAFTVTIHSFDMRPTAPGFRIFFQLKRALRKPFQVPCVFSSKTRLAFNVTVNLNDSQPTALKFLAFFKKKTRVAGILPHSSGSLSLCFLRYNASLVHKSM